MTHTTEPLAVLQCDRDAAFAVWRDLHPDSTQMQCSIMQGFADDDLTVQAFARHREQAATAATGEGVAVRFGPCQHQWRYSPTVGNITCIHCFAQDVEQRK